MSTHTDEREQFLARMFDALDAADVDSYLEFLSPDASLRFANSDPVVGREAIRDSLLEFYKVFKWVRHDYVATWSGLEGAAVEADVSYERQDGREVHVPAVTICRFNDDGLVGDYRIFVDLAPLFAS